MQRDALGLRVRRYFRAHSALGRRRRRASRLGLRARRPPPAHVPATVSRGRRSATTRSSTSDQPAGRRRAPGRPAPRRTVHAGARPPCPRAYGLVAPLFQPLLPTRYAAGSSLHQLGGNPAPRVRARLRRGLRLKDGPGRADTRAAVWLRSWRSIHSPSARTGLADQSPRAKVVRPAGRSTLTRGFAQLPGGWPTARG